MLKLKYLFENYDLAKEALRHWPYDCDTLDDMLPQFRISSNAIYPYKHAGQVCFLRLAPTEEKHRSNIAGEIEFLGYLHDNSYPALMPIPSDTGETYRTLSTAWGEYYASAFSRVAGERLDCTDLSETILFSYGKALGRLHRISAAYQPHTKKWTHAEALDWIDSVLQQYHAPDGVVFASTQLRKALAALPKTTGNYGLVHYDFELDNVFYDAASGVCSAIDFDDGMYHFFALDVEQALDSIGEAFEGEALCAAERTFCSGYRTEYPYSAEADATRPLLRCFCELYSYARLIRSVAEVFPDEPDWLIQLRAKLKSAISRKEAFLTGNPLLS